MQELDDKQLKASRRALEHDGFCLTMQQRVGKTRTALYVAYRRKLDRLMICTLKGIFDVWEKELKAWPELSNVEVKIVNYEQLHDPKNRKHFRTWLAAGRSMLLADEIHRAKKRTSKQSKGLRSTARHAMFRLGLTGTLIGQGLEDGWAIMDFIDPAIFGKFKDFAAKHLLYGGWMNRKIVGPNMDTLGEYSAVIAEYTYRVLLTEVSDRPIRVRRIKDYIDFSPVGRRHYDRLEKTLVTATRRVRVEARLVITLVQRLQQLTGGFLVSGEKREQVDASKLGRLVHWFKTLKSPLVVCCKYTHEIEAVVLCAHLLELSTCVVKGGSPLDPGWSEDVAVVQIQSGVGIDLSRARVIIFYSWDHSYINYDQFRFRVLSRTRTSVDYIFLMIKSSVDDNIYDCIARKKKLADLVYEHYNRRVA